MVRIDWKNTLILWRITRKTIRPATPAFFMGEIMNLKNRFAFLQMISVSEGTFNHGDNGYNVIVGGELFHSYADHPRILIDLPKLGIKSSAAGRYQLLARYYDAYKKSLNLPDFSPGSQDKIAIQQINESLALHDVDAGRFADAVRKCAHIWASLPGNNYHQHQNKIDALQAAYVNAGGSLV
jgi:muramidase (phage lysozyme)